MDRKYRQHGYMDKEKEKAEKSKGQPRPRTETFGPRVLNMPGARSVSRCAECGSLLQDAAGTPDRCPKCGFTLHSCKQCTHFDPSSRFECRQPILARISPKDTANSCTFYSIRVMVERETTSSGSATPTSSGGGNSRVDNARRAFENLFKK
jgi:predicted RNA-binding Zn-ribbon protein involved in translation (DUF1610 family)